MRKSTITIIILIILLVAFFVWKNTRPSAVMTDTMIEQDSLTGEVLDAQPGTTTGDTDIVTDELLDEEFLQKLEAQATVGLDGEQITDEDIKLIEEILQQISNSVE